MPRLPSTSWATKPTDRENDEFSHCDVLWLVTDAHAPLKTFTTESLGISENPTGRPAEPEPASQNSDDVAAEQSAPGGGIGDQRRDWLGHFTRNDIGQA